MVGADGEVDETLANRRRCFTHSDRGEGRGGDLLIGELLRAQAQKGAELVEGIERRALDVFRERVLLGEDLGRVSRTTQGTGAFFARRFCLTSSSSAR
jgi:hypothetical protein